jgi:hypothetical protein
MHKLWRKRRLNGRTNNQQNMFGVQAQEAPEEKRQVEKGESQT